MVIFITLFGQTACVWRLAPDMEGTTCDDPNADSISQSPPSSWIIQLQLEDQEMEDVQPTIEVGRSIPVDLMPCLIPRPTNTHRPGGSGLIVLRTTSISSVWSSV